MCELLHAMAYLINFRVEKCEASSEIGCLVMASSRLIDCIGGAEPKHDGMLTGIRICIHDPNRVFNFFVPVAHVKSLSAAFVVFHFGRLGGIKSSNAGDSIGRLLFPFFFKKEIRIFFGVCDYFFGFQIIFVSGEVETIHGLIGRTDDEDNATVVRINQWWCLLKN